MSKLFAQPTCTHLTHNPNQALVEATFRNQARNKMICRKSGTFIELSILFSRDIEKPKSRDRRVRKRRPPVRREGGRPALRGCQRCGDNGTGFTFRSPLILQAQSTLLLQLLKAREGTSDSVNTCGSPGGRKWRGRRRHWR